MNNVNDRYEKVKFKIAISKIKEEERIAMNKNFMNKKIGIAACLFLTLSTGIVFAKDIKELVINKFGLGEGIETAVENGYIEVVDMEYEASSDINEEFDIKENEGIILDNINAEIKIEDFLMDDYNLSADFSIKLENQMSNYLEIDKSVKITFPDLIVIDENNNIIYENSTKERFDSFCKENGINYCHREYNENYMNSGLNTFLNYVEKNNEVCNISSKYNMYTSTEYPKSKHLKFNINKIKFEKKNGEEEIEYIVVGSWNIDLDVPEKMYNRTAEHYKVINSENERFNIYSAKVTDTGFEIGIRISDTPKPVLPKELYNEKTESEYIFNKREELLKVSKDEEFEKEYIEYQKSLIPVQVSNNYPLYSVNWLPLNDGTYVKNSKEIDLIVL